jgi:hypothetical protein
VEHMALPEPDSSLLMEFVLVLVNHHLLNLQ